jgi:hypothetical protein
LIVKFNAKDSTKTGVIAQTTRVDVKRNSKNGNANQLNPIYL